MGGSGVVSLLKVALRNFDVLAGPIVSLIYPLHASIMAIETKSPEDDRQWLTYWVLHSFVTLIELTLYKLIWTCWLVVPYFSGAAYVYDHFVTPIFVNSEPVTVWFVPKKNNIFSQPDDFLTAVEKYIEEHGTEAFEKLIKKADKPRRRVRFADE